MRARGATVGVLLFGALALLGGCREGPRTEPVSGAIRATPEEIDFGPTALGATQLRRVELRNTGRARVRIVAVEPTLAGVHPVDFAPFDLETGQARALTLRFDADVEGAVDGELRVRTDDPASDPRRPLLRGAAVRARAEVDLTALDFGPVTVGERRTLALRVRNPAPVAGEVALLLDGADAEMFGADEAGEPWTLGAGEQRTVTIAFQPRRTGPAGAEASLRPCRGCEPLALPLQGRGIVTRLELEPGALDFGKVTVGGSVERRVVVRNVGTEPYSLRGARVVGDPAHALTLTSAPPSEPVLLSTGASAEVTLRFSPREVRALDGSRLEVDAVPVGGEGAAPSLPISGEGAPSCVAISPARLDFGLVPDAMSVTNEVVVSNRCSASVALSGIAIGAGNAAFALTEPSPTRTIAPGTAARLSVRFAPRAIRDAAGTLDFTVAEPGGTWPARVALSGTSVTLRPCEHALVPGALDFGLVPVGARVVLGAAIANTGADPCVVTDFSVVEGAGATFSAQPSGRWWIEPGQRRVLPITFRPAIDGSFAGRAEASLNHPTAGHPSLPLAGQGGSPCLTLDPTTIDFGLLGTTCAPRQREVVATNRCALDVTLRSATLGPGDSSGFALIGAPTLPLRLAPGGKATFSLAYRATRDGVETAPLRVDAGLGALLTTGLVGHGRTRTEQVDRFVQTPASKVDVLFVIDNSGSMAEEQESLGRNLASFLSSAEAGGIDYQLGVTTTGVEASTGGWTACPGGAEGGEAGRLFPVNRSGPRILSRGTPNLAAAFATNVQVGVCHWLEQGLEAARRALTSPLVDASDDPGTPAPLDGNLGFVRPDAKLAVVFLSDEDDQSAAPLDEYEAFFRALKGGDPARLTVSAIVGPDDLSSCPTASGIGARYLALARATGGAVESICTRDWAASLAAISRSAFGGQSRFVLTERPADPSRVSVTVDGVAVTGWSYDDATVSVVFTLAALPPPGAVIEVRYPLGCGAPSAL